MSEWLCSHCNKSYWWIGDSTFDKFPQECKDVYNKEYENLIKSLTNINDGIPDIICDEDDNL